MFIQMKFSVGYPNHTAGSFYDSIAPYLSSVGELYFPWTGVPSGREGFGKGDFDAEARLTGELARFHESGVKLNLLLNGACAGGLAISEALAESTCRLVDALGERFGLNAVTTASPYLAGTLRRYFPRLDVRASVNLWIDGVSGMSQCLDLFDSFYVKREYNRRPDEVKKQADFCHAKGKRLYLLANSGCLPNCPCHIFHDNLVSHEAEVSRTVNDGTFMPYNCRRVMADPANRYLLLAGNLVRPEDVKHYEGIVDGVKLATRIHFSPQTVIGAYARGRFTGDLCALTEPGFGYLFDGVYPENAALPPDFFEKTSTCSRDCESCGWCAATLEAIMRPAK